MSSVAVARSADRFRGGTAPARANWSRAATTIDSASTRRRHVRDAVLTIPQPRTVGPQRVAAQLRPGRHRPDVGVDSPLGHQTLLGRERPVDGRSGGQQLSARSGPACLMTASTDACHSFVSSASRSGNWSSSLVAEDSVGRVGSLIAAFLPGRGEGRTHGERSFGPAAKSLVCASLHYIRQNSHPCCDTEEEECHWSRGLCHRSGAYSVSTSERPCEQLKCADAGRAEREAFVPRPSPRGAAR